MSLYPIASTLLTVARLRRRRAQEQARAKAQAEEIVRAIEAAIAQIEAGPRPGGPFGPKPPGCTCPPGKGHNHPSRSAHLN